METLTRPSRKQKIAVSAALLLLKALALERKSVPTLPSDKSMYKKCEETGHAQHQPFQRLFFLLFLKGDSKRTWKLHGLAWLSNTEDK